MVKALDTRVRSSKDHGCADLWTPFKLALWRGYGFRIDLWIEGFADHLLSGEP